MLAAEFKNVCFSYPSAKALFSGISFSVPEGANIGLVGANGAGKTTLLHLLLGLIAPDSGIITVSGLNLNEKNLRAVRRYASLAFQDPMDQLFCSTVLEDVAFGPRQMGESAESARKIAESTLDTLGISRLGGKAPYQISGGEARLSAIASVLSMSPELMCMDEPSSGLDPRSRRELIALLRELDCTKLIASHDLDMVRKLCTGVIIIHNGVVAASGDANVLLADEELLLSVGL